jgi:hypothetical protein
MITAGAARSRHSSGTPYVLERYSAHRACPAFPSAHPLGRAAGHRHLIPLPRGVLQGQDPPLLLTGLHRPGHPPRPAPREASCAPIRMYSSRGRGNWKRHLAFRSRAPANWYGRKATADSALPDAVPAWRSSPSLRILPRSARSSPASSATAGGHLSWGKQADHLTPHLTGLYSHGGGMSTPARARFMQVQKELPRRVMTPSILTIHPSQWSRDRREHDGTVLWRKSLYRQRGDAR